ncbi:MAG: D-alanine--D-alanine ligase [Sphaerochaetaceae bacterium]|nr:D-alanine--D-alanine ligase [Sphaerochaetaceae bacterium]
MNIKRIALLYGGRSVEHEISIASASNIHRHLIDAGFIVYPIWISKTGRWYLQTATDMLLPHLSSDANELLLQMGKGILFKMNGEQLDIDICFPIVHGSNGEDGVLQGVLDAARIPYVGSPVHSSALGMQKQFSKIIASHLGIPTSRWKTVDVATAKRMNEDATYLESFCMNDLFDFSDTIVLKPVDGGSSVGVHVVQRNASDAVLHAINEVLSYSESCLIEPHITEMVEIECGLLEEHGHLIVSGCGMVHNDDSTGLQFLSYEKKYDPTHCATMIIPAPIIDDHARRIRQYAVQFGLAVNIRGFARVDFFYQPRTGIILFNEINTLPGMTANSHFPRLMAHQGYTWEKILLALFESATTRFSMMDSLKINR